MNIRKSLLKMTAMLVMAALLLPGLSPQVPAQEPTVDYILNRLNAIDFGREIYFFPLDDSVRACGQDNILHFDTIEELEDFVRAFVGIHTESNLAAEIEWKLMNGWETIEEFRVDFAPLGHFERSVTWRDSVGIVPAMTTKRIAFSFYRPPGTTQPQSPRILDSWITGFTAGVSWTHRFGNAHVLYHPPTGASMIGLWATGTWHIGVDESFDATWEMSAHSGVDF